MTVRRRESTSTGPPIETNEHAPNSRAVQTVPAESALSDPQVRTRVGIGLFAVATVALFGMSLPFVALPSSLGVLAALLLALGTLVVGTATD